MSAKIIAIANQKGGVGKTTSTINLGVSLAALGKRVLLVDLDSQANLTMCLGHDPDELTFAITDLLSKSIDDEPAEKALYLLHTEGVDLIPSDIRLSGMEAVMVNVTDMGRETVLQYALSPYKDDYDYVLIDCMPSLNIMTINALVAAESVLIPVQSHYLSAKGLEMLLGTLGKVKKRLNPGLQIEGILLTMYDKRTNFARTVADSIRQNYGEEIRIFDTIIPLSVKAAETSAQGKSIFEYDPHGRVAEAYAELSKEVQDFGKINV